MDELQRYLISFRHIWVSGVKDAHVSFGLSWVPGTDGIKHFEQRNTIVRGLSNNSNAKARLVSQEKVLMAKELKPCVTNVVLVKIVRIECTDSLKLLPVQSGG